MAVMLPVYTAVNLALGPNLDTRFINVLNTTDGGDIRVFDTRHNLPFKWLVGSEQFCPDQTFYPLLFVPQFCSRQSRTLLSVRCPPVVGACPPFQLTISVEMTW